MIFVAATGAAKAGLHDPGRGIDVVALRAFLRGIRGLHQHQPRAVLPALLDEVREERAPAHREDVAVEAPLLRDPCPRFLHGARGGPGHLLDPQVFEHDDAVVLGVAVRVGPQQVLPLPPHLAVRAGQLDLGLLSVLRSLLLPGDSPGQLGYLGGPRFEEGGVLDEGAVGVGDQVGDTTVDAHRRLRGLLGASLRRQRVRHLNYDADVPSVHVSRDGRGPSLPLGQRTVQHQRDAAQAGEAEEVAPFVARDAPGTLRIRLGDAHRITPAPLELRSAFGFGEAVLPGGVEVTEDLLAGIAGDVVDPRHLRPQVREFFLLIDSGAVPLGGAEASKASETLLVREVPQRPQRTFPAEHLCDLLLARIDSVLRDQMTHKRHHARSAFSGQRPVRS